MAATGETMEEERVIIPPHRFHWIIHSNGNGSGSGSQALCRGSQPTHRNVNFLRGLQLKSILSLTPLPIEDPLLVVDLTSSASTSSSSSNSNSNDNHGLNDMMQSTTITQIQHIKVEAPTEDGMPTGFTRQIQFHILPFLLDKTNLPCFVHCLDGGLVCSLVFGCLRKLEGWSLASILTESSHFSREGESSGAGNGGSSFIPEERALIESFCSNSGGSGGGGSSLGTGGMSSAMPGTSTTSNTPQPTVQTSSQGSADIFEVSAALSLRLPSWLWGGHSSYSSLLSICKRHPSMRIRVVAQPQSTSAQTHGHERSLTGGGGGSPLNMAVNASGGSVGGVASILQQMHLDGGSQVAGGSQFQLFQLQQQQLLQQQQILQQQHRISVNGGNTTFNNDYNPIGGGIPPSRNSISSNSRHSSHTNTSVIANSQIPINTGSLTPGSGGGNSRQTESPTRSEERETGEERGEDESPTSQTSSAHNPHRKNNGKEATNGDTTISGIATRIEDEDDLYGADEEDDGLILDRSRFSRTIVALDLEMGQLGGSNVASPLGSGSVYDRNGARRMTGNSGKGE